MRLSAGFRMTGITIACGSHSPFGLNPCDTERGFSISEILKRLPSFSTFQSCKLKAQHSGEQFSLSALAQFLPALTHLDLFDVWPERDSCTDFPITGVTSSNTCLGLKHVLVVVACMPDLTTLQHRAFSPFCYSPDQCHWQWKDYRSFQVQLQIIQNAVRVVSGSSQLSDWTLEKEEFNTLTWRRYYSFATQVTAVLPRV